METTLQKHDINAVLEQFKLISLEEMNDVKLLNRFDKKYCVNMKQLQNILEAVSGHYYILKIDGIKIQTYHSVYYDTPCDLFYLSHHNGIGSRYKIRKREYVNSGISFFEIKHKTNKGKTNKKRIPALSVIPAITATENRFIYAATNHIFEGLTVKSENTFNRITLVSKTFDERCTIDINITIESNDKTLTLTDFAVIELKQGTLNMKSELTGVLKTARIYQLGFSKYCMGRALSEGNLKKNMFKSKILKIRKKYNLLSLQKSQDYVYSKIG